MNWTELVAVLALLQYIFFAVLVGQARGRYGVKAPAVTGDERFERVYRVQMNTLELLVALLPALWLAARVWPDAWVGAAGALYLIGRFLYWRAYVADPKGRSLGFALSITPVLVLLLVGLWGAVRGAVVAG